MKDLQKSIDALINGAAAIPNDEKYNCVFEEIIECLRKLQTMNLRQQYRKNKSRSEPSVSFTPPLPQIELILDRDKAQIPKE